MWVVVEWIRDGHPTNLGAASGIVAGLVVGKVIGIFGGAWVAVRLRLGALPSGIGWADVLPVAALGGIGYTVSLLVTHLSFDDRLAQERAGIAVLVASTIASVLGVVLVRRRARFHAGDTLDGG